MELFPIKYDITWTQYVEVWFKEFTWKDGRKQNVDQDRGIKTYLKQIALIVLILTVRLNF